ncbi:hypothetical protein AB4Y45_32685 [Paraburkholderia sp. EG287A]|uniref:hypothetical protein n=1 Tax=Paraburkholderia sp. EG287A TaxID=3237012 RepID=UPI0034D356B2
MDHPYEDEFPRVAGHPINNDKALSDAGREFDAMTDEAQDADLEKMMHARAEMERAVIGEGADHAILEPDEEVFKRFDPKEIESNAKQAGVQATEQATAAATAEATTAGAAPEAGQATAPANKELVKPHSVDEALAAIRLRDNSHQRRFVVVGDENIKRAFYDYLEQNGKLKYHNGTPVIGMSQKKTLKTLQEFVAREYAGSGVTHALHMTARREGLTGGIKNALGSRSTIDVIVVGDQAMQSEKMKELGDTLGRLQAENKFTTRGDGAKFPVKDGKLELPLDQSGNRAATDQARAGLATENGSAPGKPRPVVLEASVGLGSLLIRSKDLVNTWQAEVQRQKDERNAPKQPKNENEKDAGKTPTETPNNLATDVARRLNEAMSNSASLSEKHGRGTTADNLMHTATRLNDPLVREVATLPTETRQQMLVQLSALATKLDAKEFGEDARKVLDTPHKAPDKGPEAAHGDVRSPREKLTAWLAAEVATDPQFAEKAKALTQSLVEKHALTPEQADRVNQMIAQASIQKEAVAAHAASQAGAQVDASRAPDAAAEQADAGKDAATASAPAAENANAAAEAGTVSAQVPEAADTASATPRDAASTVESATVAPATASAEATTINSGTATFGDRLAEVTKDGYEAVSERGARSIISELEVLAQRGAPLSDLARREEMGDPQGATRSLAQVRGLLLSASMGQFGDDLATRAEALHGAVRDWTNESKANLAATQEASRANEAAQAATTTAAPQVAEKAALEREPGIATGAREESTRAVSDTFAVRLSNSLKDMDGASQLTTEQARGIINELEARKGESLATLGEGEGRSIYPGGSRTLEQVKVVLLSASMGQFGDDLAKRADALHPAVREWTAQENERIAVVKDEHRAERAQTEAAAAAPVSPVRIDAPVQPTAEQASTASARESTAKETSTASTTNDAAVLAKEAVPNAGVRMARMQAGSGADAEQQSARSPGQQTASGPSTTQAGAEAKAAATAARSAEHAHTGGAHHGGQSSAVSEQTSAHAATLYKHMANPAGSFTRRDKSWNLSNIGKVAQAIAGLDLKETAKMPSAERTTLAAYAVWMADSANAGKLPGFSSPGGKQLAAQMTEKAVSLTQQVDGPLPASTQKEMAKAERMVDAKLAHDVKLERTAQVAERATVERAGPEASNMKGYVQDLVHAVYRQSEMNEGYANYLLKNGANLKVEDLRGFDADTKARTVAALSFLAGEVRNSAMGDFDQLSPGVKRNVEAAQHVANSLYDQLSREPGMATVLTKAYMEVNTGVVTANDKSLVAERTSQTEALDSATSKAGSKEIDKSPAGKAESGVEDTGTKRGGSSRSRGFELGD